MSDPIYEAQAYEIAKMARSISALESENANLKSLLREALEKKFSDEDKLQSENERLRELVQELWEGYQDPPCEDCPIKGKPACADCPICAREAAVIDRMRELGIEVAE